MRRWLAKHKYLVALAAFFALGALIWGRPTVGGDGYYYYSIYDMFTATGKVTTTQPEKYTKFADWALGTRDGINYSSIAFHGTALMWAPFILPASLIDQLSFLTSINDYLLTTTGITLGDGIGVLTAATTYALFSVYCTYLWLAKYFSKRNSLVSALAIFIAQYGLFYTFTDASYTHVLVGFICALAFYLFSRATSPRSYLVLGLVLGLGTIIRAENALFALPFCISLLAHKQIKFLSYLGAGMLSVCISLPIYSYLAYGNPFTSGYAAVGGLENGFALTNFNLLNLLFSDIRGLFIWSPLLVFALVGFYLNWRKRQNTMLTAMVFVTVCVFVLFYSFWFSWWAGGSVGQRFFMGLFPLFAFGLASFHQHLHQGVGKIKLVWRGWLMILLLSSFFAVFIARTYSNFDRNQFVKFAVPEKIMGQVPESEQYSVFDLLGLGYREYRLAEFSELVQLPLKLVLTPHLDGRRSLIQMVGLVGRAGELENGSLIAIRELRGDQIIYTIDTENLQSLTVVIKQNEQSLTSVEKVNSQQITIVCEKNYQCELYDQVVTLNANDEFKIYVYEGSQTEVKLSNNQIYFTAEQAKLHISK